ncbi:MAG: orotidine-5'-phosphate decarboxylase [Myxococcota bacterium]
MSSFLERLASRVERVGAPVCIGLDPHRSRIGGGAVDPDPATRAEAVEAFARDALEAMAPYAAIVKPQAAFFEALGPRGAGVLHRTVAHAHQLGLLVLLDVKRGDIGSTAEAYAEALFDHPPGDADAVTLSPYLGPESLEPFVERTKADRGCFVLVRTSNPGAAPWQSVTGVAEAVADWVAQQPPSVGVVIGATLSVPEQVAWRARLPGRWILAPGFGAQGGTFDALRALGPQVLPTSSRGVLYGAGPESEVTRRAAIASRAEAFREAVVTALQ